MERHDSAVDVLVVEDEPTLARILCDALRAGGFSCEAASDGREGLGMFFRLGPKVVVTDIMMPALDGFSLVERIRGSDSSVQILFLSARSSADDVVRGFDLGANDYLRKPFAMTELIARVKALVMRHPAAAEAALPAEFRIGRFVFDTARWTLSDGCRREVLPNREARVLAMLCRHMNEVVDTRSILMEIWGDDSYFNARSLNVFVTKLRHRLAADGSVRIVNARGVGYRLQIDG